MLTIGKECLQLSLHAPGDGFYQGTRFDRSGIFDSLVFRGVDMCGRWFEKYDPFMHDAVCGPAEEFAPVGFGSAAPGGVFFKPGVGLLVRPDNSPYDRFRLYDIADEGEWTVQRDTGAVRFEHRLKGHYLYRKDIVLTGPVSFEIRHSVVPERHLETLVYNHNFFTFGKMSTGPSRTMSFPFVPEGTWRSEYDSVAFTPSGVRFIRSLNKGESVYSGDIHARGQAGMPYALELGEPPVSVRIRGDVPVVHTVLWANHRIACLEPYNMVSAAPGGSFCWNVEYEFDYED
ncbi:MAG: hypothetical protein J6X71_03250 [Bacteroidales bacterium]|nr:hypothetical protein [Bacteroidales bacterium]